MRIIDAKKRGLCLLIIALPFFFLLQLISYGTAIPFVSLFLFLIIGIYLVAKKEMFAYCCNNTKQKQSQPIKIKRKNITRQINMDRQKRCAKNAQPF
jgi:hypothetical protein